MPRRMRALSLVTVLVLSVVTAGVAAPAGAQTATEPERIDSCRTISEPGQYVLTEDVENASETCIEITASDVVLDGDGHTIGGVQTNTTLDAFVAASYGDAVDNETNATVDDGTATPWNPRFGNVGVAANASGGQSNVTVTDLTVRNFVFGVYYGSVTEGRIANVTAAGNGDGLELYGSQVTVSNATLTDNAWGAFAWNSSDSEFAGVTAADNRETGVYVSEATNVTVAGSSANDNGASGVLLDAVTGGSVVDVEASGNQYAGVALFGSSGNFLVNVTASGTGNAGVGLFEASTANVFSDLTVTDTTGADDVSAASGYSAGVAVENGSSGNQFVDVVATNNTGWAYYAANGSADNAVSNLTLADDSTVSLSGTDVAVALADDRPTPPEGTTAVDPYLDVDDTSDAATAALNVSYAPGAVESIDEGTLGLQVYDGSEWTAIEDSAVNEERNYVTGNLTAFGVVVPVGGTNATDAASDAGDGTATAVGGAGAD